MFYVLGAISQQASTNNIVMNIFWVIIVIFVIVISLRAIFSKGDTRDEKKLSLAKKEIERLRKGLDDFCDPENIETVLQEGRSLQDIDPSLTQEEFGNLMWRRRGRIYVRHELNKISERPIGIKLLMQYMGKRGIKPREVHTTWDELNELRRDEEERILLDKLLILRREALGVGKAYFLDPHKICEDIMNSGFVPEELGTTNEELVSLRKRAWLNQARLWWERRKSNVDGGNSYDIISLPEFTSMLRKAGASLKDLGISVADLISLRGRNSILQAKDTLEVLRQRIWFLPIDNYYTGMDVRLALPGNPEVVLGRLNRELAVADAKLEDIGSSQEEIDSLIPQAYHYSANFLLWFTRERLAAGEPNERTKQEMRRNVAAIRVYLEKLGKKPEDYKTSNQELDALAA